MKAAQLFCSALVHMPLVYASEWKHNLLQQVNLQPLSWLLLQPQAPREHQLQLQSASLHLLCEDCQNIEQPSTLEDFVFR